MVIVIGLHLLSLFLTTSCQNNVYWGSYELTIPGGSGSGNAVQHLSLPDNAPEFFQFSALKNGPLPASSAVAPTFQNGPAVATTFQNGPAVAPTFQNGPAVAPTFPPVQQIKVQPKPGFQQQPSQLSVGHFRPQQQQSQEHLIVQPHPEDNLPGLDLQTSTVNNNKGFILKKEENSNEEEELSRFELYKKRKMLSRGLKVQIKGAQADVPSNNKIVARRLQKHEIIPVEEEVTNNPSKKNIVARRKIAVRRRKINN